MPTASAPITVLLQAARSGDADAADALFAKVYAELKVLARSHRRRWHGNATLNTTALIHELFIKLSDQRSPDYANRTHFFATASKAMRQVLVSYARKQGAQKRGGDALHITLDDIRVDSEVSAEELLDLSEVLDRLEHEHPRQCRIVECRIIAGMTIEEVAEVLDVSPATVKREWRLATARIYQALHDGPAR